jgi:hypothetical protein
MCLCAYDLLYILTIADSLQAAHGIEVARRFRGHANLHLVEETHSGTQFGFKREIMEELLRSGT